MEVLLQDKRIQLLLRHDIVLVGSVVREALSGMAFHKFDGTVVGRAYYKDWLVVNRVLHELTEKMTVESDSHINLVALYNLRDEDNDCLRVRLSFVKNAMSSNFPRLDVDVNTLCLSRNGIFVDGNLYEKEPVPLARLWQQCQKRQFRLAHSTPFNDVKWCVQRVQSLIDQGWQFLESSIERATSTPDDICSICRDPLRSKRITVVTSCEHYFHEDCWRSHVNATQNTTEFSFSPIKLTCPMCRTEFSPWAVLTPNNP